jgi:DNA polymerase-4
MPRKIIHLDLDAFFCAVEELHNPTLRGKAFAVGGRPEERGVVASCSYAARQHGVRSAMPMSQALRLCPGLLIAPAQHKAYRAISQQVMARLRALTPLVEQLSIDEAFLDVTDHPDDAATLAQRLQQTINVELKLPCSLGVATNKLVAKIANNVGKTAAKDAAPRGRPPNAITIAPPGEEAAFLAPLPCAELWGVGPKMESRLAQLGIHTIGELAAWPEKELIARFGKNGYDLSRHARGLDNRSVVTQHEAKSISQETTFVRDVTDGADLRRTLQEQAAAVSQELHRKRLTATTVKLKLRWSDFTTITRQTMTPQPTDDGAQIYSAAVRLLANAWQGEPVRLIGVGVSGLGALPRQLGLWDQPNEKEERLQAAIKKLQARFGENVVQRADLLAAFEEK